MDALISFWTLLRWASLGIAGTVGSVLCYRAARAIYDDLYNRYRQWQHDALTVSHIQTQNKLNAVRRLPPDANGRHGIVYDGEVYHNMDSGEVFTQLATLYLDPMRSQLDVIQRTLIAMRGVPGGNAARVPQLAEPAPAAARWPERIYLDEILNRYHITPSIDHLLLGVTYDQAGHERPVVGDMEEMIHILIGGASGFGKSTLAEALACQLATGEPRCDLVVIDYGVNTFGALESSGRLLYPIADTPDAAIAVLNALIQELNRRRSLYRDYPRVKKLSQYNQISDTPLRPIVCFCDEAQQLFIKKGIQEPLAELVSMARKFGLWVVASGTDFKATTLPSETRGSFSTSIAFRSRPSMSRILIYTKDAMNLPAKGRALALLPGRDMVEMQTPMVRDWSGISGGGPQRSLQIETPWPGTPADEIDDPSLPAEERVVRLHDAGASDTAIARQVFKYGNSFYIAKVRAILAARDVVVSSGDTPAGPAATDNNDNDNTHDTPGAHPT